jgi:hypothetical protein
MTLKNKLKLAPCAGLLACIAALSGCGYEEGFEYTTEAQLLAMHDSGASGHVTIGYGIRDPRLRMRIVLRGLAKDGIYQLRFFDSGSCSDGALAKAQRIDAQSEDPGRQEGAWGFSAEPLVLTANYFGHAEQEFVIKAPLHGSNDGRDSGKYPAVVVYALTPAKASAGTPLESAACGAIATAPTNKRPHT